MRPFTTVLLMLALSACSLVDRSFLADKPRPDGKAPVRILTRYRTAVALAPRRLDRAIEDLMLDLSREPARETLAYDAMLKIGDVYREAGYPDVKVSFSIDRSQEAAEKPKLTVNFKITEGPQVTVSELVIDGNEHVDRERIMKMWRRRLSGTLGLGDPIFVESSLRALAADMLVYYRSRGFLDMTVLGPKVEREDGSTHARVSYAVHEGPRYDLTEVQVDDMMQTALGKDLSRGTLPRPFSMRDVQKMYVEVRSKLRHLGHADPKIEFRQRRDREKATIQIRLGGDPGPVVKVGALEVKGNERTLDSIILDKFHLEIGQRFDGDEEDRALRQLHLTGLFRKIDVRHEDMGEGRVRLVVEVEEVDSRSLETLLGYGSFEKLRGGLRFEEANLFGTQRILILDGKVSFKGYRTSMTVADPDFLGSGFRLGVTPELFRREERSFTDSAFGVTTELSRRLAKNVTMRTGYRFRDRRNPTTDVVAARQSLDFTEGSAFLELRHDGRDSPIFPTSGHTETLTFDAFDSSLGGDVSFFRLRARAMGVIPISGTTRIALRAESGWLWPQDGSANVPIQERFFNGGENTVRSFRESQLGPKDIAGNPVGGEFRNLFSTELRVPVVLNLEGALFVDAGNVGRDVSDFSLDHMRFAIGGGLRAFLPIGPVRLDAAWNPDQEPGDRSWTVHLSVGYPF